MSCTASTTELTEMLSKHSKYFVFWHVRWPQGLQDKSVRLTTCLVVGYGPVAFGSVGPKIARDRNVHTCRNMNH